MKKTETETKVKKQVKSKKQWTIELIEYTDGTTQLTRKNNGFNAFELLGLANKSTHEILYQISSGIKPTETKLNIKKK